MKLTMKEAVIVFGISDTTLRLWEEQNFISSSVIDGKKMVDSTEIEPLWAAHVIKGQTTILSKKLENYRTKLLLRGRKK